MNATFARLGVPAEKGSGWLLARLIGSARALDLLYSARRIDGVEAERLGVVNAVLPDEALLAHATAYARQIAANAAPRALAAMKAQVWSAIDDPYDKGFADADHEQDLCTQTEDFQTRARLSRDLIPSDRKGDLILELAAKVLISLVALATGLAPMRADFNATHATNPLWPPHARFHVVWQVLCQTGVSGFILYLAWVASFPGALITAAVMNFIWTLSFFLTLANMQRFGG
eukprot:gene12242-15579_t